MYGERRFVVRGDVCGDWVSDVDLVLCSLYVLDVEARIDDEEGKKE